MGWIYLINELGTNNYKIGVTNAKEINKRKLELQTGNSNELHICRSFKSEHPYKLEKLLHLNYHKYHKLNEWFELSDEEVLYFLDVCQKYQDSLLFVEKNNEFFSKL